MTTYKDSELTCADCRGVFFWGAREQELYAEKGYPPPARCNGCKQAQRHEFEHRGKGMSKEQAELDKARELISEVVDKGKEPVPNTVDDGSGALDPRFALWRSFCAEHGVPVETLPGDLADPLKERWQDFKDKEIHAPEEGRT